MNISKQDFQTSLNYIRISKMKKLKKIMFDCYFAIFKFFEKLNNIR